MLMAPHGNALKWNLFVLVEVGFVRRRNRLVHGGGMIPAIVLELAEAHLDFLAGQPITVAAVGVHQNFGVGGVQRENVATLEKQLEFAELAFLYANDGVALRVLADMIGFDEAWAGVLFQIKAWHNCFLSCHVVRVRNARAVRRPSRAEAQVKCWVSVK